MPTVSPQQPEATPIAVPLDDLASLVEQAAAAGRLAELIALACDRAVTYFPPDHADPGHQTIPAVQAAVDAFAEEADDFEPSETDVLTDALLGQWVAWSADLTRIMGHHPELEEAVRLAQQAGEPEPIMQRHTRGRYWR